MWIQWYVCWREAMDCEFSEKLIIESFENANEFDAKITDHQARFCTFSISLGLAGVRGLHLYCLSLCICTCLLKFACIRFRFWIVWMYPCCQTHGLQNQILFVFDLTFISKCFSYILGPPCQSHWSENQILHVFDFVFLNSFDISNALHAKVMDHKIRFCSYSISIFSELYK